MKNTIVKKEEPANFSIIPSPLISVITGGIQRYVSRNETVIMDGSFSHDPDFPNDKNLV